MTRALTLLIAIGSLVLAKDAKPQPAPAPVTKTQRMDFPENGTLRFTNSTGELTVEAWDQAGMEITTTLSAKINEPAKDLDLVKVSVERKGDGVVVATEYPLTRVGKVAKHYGAPVGFYLEYRVKLPKSAKVIVDHNIGDLHFDGIEGDIHATARQSNITLQLPEKAQYAIDAKCNVGSIVSDFAGKSKPRYWFTGQAFTETAQAPHKLYLRNGFGDIILFKTPAPVSLLPAMNP